MAARSYYSVLYLLIAAGPMLPLSAAAAVPKIQASVPFETEATAIFAVLNKQAADWNRGDLDAFATGYKDSPDILFIGKTIAHGYSHLLSTYKAHYPTPASMGQLSFTHLDAQRLDAQFATVTGHYHLQRTAAGGGDADGYFLLVMEKTPSGWKIVRDDTTNLPSSTE